METEQAVKISLCCQTAQKAVELLRDTFKEADFEEIISVDRYLNIKAVIEGAEIVLSDLYSDIHEYLETFDAKDEQAIIDMVCKIEKMVAGKIEPVEVHPEITTDMIGFAKKMVGFHNWEKIC